MLVYCQSAALATVTEMALKFKHVQHLTLVCHSSYRATINGNQSYQSHMMAINWALFALSFHVNICQVSTTNALLHSATYIPC